LASGHYLDPALHRWFVDRHQQLAALSLVEFVSAQLTASHWWASGGPRIPSCSSSMLPVL
ncbi:hypothetical protein HAX54_008700, partial [Datura stramonium]|nr:hypothetical protein [Datura stramonium]